MHNSHLLFDPGQRRQWRGACHTCVCVIAAATLPSCAVNPVGSSSAPDPRYVSTSNRCHESAEVRQRIAVSSFPVHAMDVRIGFNPDVYQSCMKAAGFKTVTVETAP